MISVDSYALIKDGSTDLEKLEKLPYPGVDTIFKAMKYNVERIPNMELLGTRVKDEYKWLTWK